MVAPRPTASPAPERAISLVSTTLVVPLLDFGQLPAELHSLGTPAARQMLSHMPLAVKSPCTDGSQTKPTSRAATVSPPKPKTLQRNQRLLHAYRAGFLHHRPPMGMAGTEVSFSDGELRDRKAVVHDRKRDHHASQRPKPFRATGVRRRHVDRRC